MTEFVTSYEVLELRKNFSRLHHDFQALSRLLSAYEVPLPSASINHHFHFTDTQLTELYRKVEDKEAAILDYMKIRSLGTAQTSEYKTLLEIFETKLDQLQVARSDLEANMGHLEYAAFEIIGRDALQPPDTVREHSKTISNKCKLSVMSSKGNKQPRLMPGSNLKVNAPENTRAPTGNVLLSASRTDSANFLDLVSATRLDTPTTLPVLATWDTRSPQIPKLESAIKFTRHQPATISTNRPMFNKKHSPRASVNRKKAKVATQGLPSKAKAQRLSKAHVSLSSNPVTAKQKANIKGEASSINQLFNDLQTAPMTLRESAKSIVRRPTTPSPLATRRQPKRSPGKGTRAIFYGNVGKLAHKYWKIIDSYSFQSIFDLNSYGNREKFFNNQDLWKLKNPNATSYPPTPQIDMRMKGSARAQTISDFLEQALRHPTKVERTRQVMKSLVEMDASCAWRRKGLGATEISSKLKDSLKEINDRVEEYIKNATKSPLSAGE